MTTPKRANRYTREPAKLPPFQLTEQDYEIVRAIGVYRVAKSTHIDQRFAEANADHLRRRLQQLYHHGFLDRVRQKTEDDRPYWGSTHMSYTLTPKSVRMIAEKEGLELRPPNVVGQLAHALSAADFLVAIDRACVRSNNLRFVPFARLVQSVPQVTRLEARPAEWKVAVQIGAERRSCHIRPDDIIAVAHTGLPEPDNKLFFFVEIDRASMPIIRSNPFQSSIVRKFRTYNASFEAKIPLLRYGMSNVRVLFVTKSQERVRSMIEAHQKELARLGGHYLFIDEATLHRGEQPFLKTLWRNARGEETTLFPSDSGK